jgi:hypothetical protein
MKQNILRFACLAALLCGMAVPASAGDLKLTMNGGRVTILANDVSVRQILQEWARVGHATVVNTDKLSGPNLTLQLIDVPEKDALDILLRSASGYIAAPRAMALAGASMYDRVTIMATSQPPAATMASVPPPTFQRQPAPIEDDEPVNIVMPNQAPPQNPVFGQYPGMPTAQPQPQPGQPGMMAPQLQSQPGAPVTAPRPGALPVPQQPNGVPNPYQPTVVRPVGPGGGGPGRQS